MVEIPPTLLEAKNQAVVDYFERHPVRIVSTLNPLGLEIWNSEHHDSNNSPQEITHVNNPVPEDSEL